MPKNTKVLKLTFGERTSTPERGIASDGRRLIEERTKIRPKVDRGANKTLAEGYLKSEQKIRPKVD